MQLDDFIKNTLVSISNGVKIANEEIDKKRNNPAEKVFLLRPGSEQEKGQGVAFDVAVTTEKSGNADTGISIAVVGLSLGGKVELSNQVVSRIQFVVNLGQWHG
jgi:hypothetical protein